MVISVPISFRRQTGHLFRTSVAIAIFVPDVFRADGVSEIVSGMSHSLTVPVSAKLRLCQPAPKTLDLAKRLEACGASWITLHPRTVSARRRRQGAADLNEVKRLKDHMNIPIISNGNVRVWDDIQDNIMFTGADGVMIGESLLENPWSVTHPPLAFRPHDLLICALSLFANTLPDPVDISLEYLELCREYLGTATIPNIQTHIRHFIDFQWLAPSSPCSMPDLSLRISAYL